MKKSLVLRFITISLWGLFLGINCHAQETVQSESTQSVIITGDKNTSTWLRAESQHFVLISDTSKENVIQLLNNLERLDSVLRIYTRAYNKAANAEQKLTLYFLRNLAEFNQIATDHPANAIGLYNSCSASVQSFGVHLEPISDLKNDQLVKGSINESLSYIFEAYARHFLYRNTDIRTPTSFIDGFAHYFSSARFSDNQVVLGRVPVNLGRYLYFIDNGHRYSLDYRDIFEQNESVGKNYAGAAGVKLEFEAKSWLLTHFMLATEANRKHLTDYLNAIYHDIPAAIAFETAFGISGDDISSVLWRYRLNSVQVMQVDMPSLPVAKISFSNLPQSANDFIIYDAILKSCPNRHDAEGLLHSLEHEAGKFPNSDFVQMTLSRAQIDWGNPQTALPYLSKAVQKNNSNFEAVFLLGLANLKMAELHGNGTNAPFINAAQTNFSIANRINPKSPSVAQAYLKSELLASLEPDTQALENIISAWQEARELPALTKLAALVHAYRGNTVKANSILRYMIVNTRSPELASWANNWKNKLNTNLPRNEILDEMRMAFQSDAIFKEWTIENGSVMQNVEFNAGLEKAQNTIDQMAQNPVADKALQAIPVPR